MLNLLNNIFQKEISNQRYSNILYINIFIIYHALDKFKKEIKPNIQECFKLINNNEIYNLIEAFISFDKNYSFYDHYKYNSKKNIFFNKSNKRLRNFGKGPLNVILKILKDNKIQEIKITEEDYFSCRKYDNLNNINKLNSFKETEEKKNVKSNNTNNIISSFNCLFKDKKFNKIDNNLSYEDLVFNFIEKNNKTFQIKEENNLYYSNKEIILDKDYILVILNYHDFIIKNAIFEDDLKEVLILITPENHIKNGLNFNNFGNSIYNIYKNIFMIKNGIKMYFYELLEKSQNIQLVCVNLREDIEIVGSFEFSNECCIFSTNKGLLFYEWNKNEILRIISLSNIDLKYNLILVNKFILAGVNDNHIIFYNLIDNKLEEIKILIGSKNVKFINIKDSNYFIIINDKKKICILRIKENGNFDFWNSNH